MRQAEAARKAAAAAVATELEHVNEKSRQAVGLLERALTDTFGAATATGHLVELRERFEDEDERGELIHLSPGEIIVLLCRRLGVTLDWNRWAPEPWAREAVAAEALVTEVAAAGGWVLADETPLHGSMSPRLRAALAALGRGPPTPG